MNLRDQSLPLFLPYPVVSLFSVLPYTRISSYSVYFLHLLIACTCFYVCSLLLPIASRLVFALY